MAPLNPYFLQGSPSEQRLVQDLINEQLRMYGQDVVYLPRNIIDEKKVIREIVSSEFDDNFRIEAYISNYDGFGGQGDILSKFGVRSTDELTLIISRERYEDFIYKFISNDPRIKLKSRPQEGDLIYIPLDNAIFEIKYVEGKRPFYQLNNLYVYELRCELFEYEDEVFDTGLQEVDEAIKPFGYTQTLQMVRISSSAGLITSTYTNNSQGTYSVQYIDLINDGYGYTATPTILISEPGISTFSRATAVAIMTSRGAPNNLSIEKIYITNPGAGYTETPTISIIGGGGSGGIATAVLAQGTLGPITIGSTGLGYPVVPTITVSGPSIGTTAVIITRINSSGSITTAYYANAGSGYTGNPNITTPNPNIQYSGNYKFNEIVKGVSSGTTAYVKEWNGNNKILTIGITDGEFVPGENIVGIGTTLGGSNAIYRYQKSEGTTNKSIYEENDIIEEFADSILDFSERNPFGEF
jgi:hypothetical protein